MSALTRATHEAQDALFYMGINPSEVTTDPRIAIFYELAVTSVIEFGEDTVHPTDYDSKDLPEIKEAIDGSN